MDDVIVTRADRERAAMWYGVALCQFIDRWIVDGHDAGVEGVAPARLVELAREFAAVRAEASGRHVIGWRVRWSVSEPASSILLTRDSARALADTLRTLEGHTNVRLLRVVRRRKGGR